MELLVDGAQPIVVASRGGVHAGEYRTFTLPGWNPRHYLATIDLLGVCRVDYAVDYRTRRARVV